MPLALLFVGGGALVFGAAAGGAALGALRGGRWASAGRRGVAGLLLLALGGLAGADAHILKWHPWVNILGLHTAYELDRVTGRYRDVTEERTKPHTAYALARPTPVDLFAIARRRLLGPLVDAEYGSAAFVPAATHAEYEVRVSTSGLLMRQVPPTSTP